METQARRVTAKWEQFDRRCRPSVLPMEGPCMEHFQAVGLVLGGIDHLRGRFLAGTPCSSTHLLWCLVSGKVRCKNSSGGHLLKPGQFALCPAGTSHWITLASSSAKGLWFHFQDQPRWSPLKALSARVGELPEIGVIETAMESCIREFEKGDPQSQHMSSLYAEIVSLHLSRFVEREISGANLPSEKLTLLWETIAAEPAMAWSIPRLAKELGLCGSYLHETCVRHYGCGPMERVAQIRMRHASILLIHSTKGLEEVAEAVGYGTAFSFSHAFQRHMGCRPGAWRQKFRVG